EAGTEVGDSVAVLTGALSLFTSLSVTVIVEVAVPSATTDAGEADTVDCAAVTAPAVNVTVAVCVTVTVSVVSVAVKTSAPAVVRSEERRVGQEATPGPEAGRL